VNLHSSASISFSIVVTVGDEPYAHCWSVAVFLLIETNMQLPIDTDALPPVGTSSHSLPKIPHHWLGFGSQQPHHRGQAHGHEGTSSWTRNPRTHYAPVV
jgi:hypothetical protein